MAAPDKPTLHGLEDKWREHWEHEGTYRFERDETTRPAFSIDTPPPTVSGSLHVGHAFSYTHTDLVARFHRMRGERVFYPMGWDDNGLPTERRVQLVYNVRCDPSLPYETALTREPGTKGRPLSISRRNFVELCLDLTAQDERSFEHLWRYLGLSIDWSLSYTTISLHAQKISQLAFLDDMIGGRAYRARTPVPWDLDFASAIAQAEIEDREVASAYHRLRFTLADGRELPIDTTRPELLPACVAMVAHPDDERYSPLAGSLVTTPMFGARVPLLLHPDADPEKGTGVAMVCTFGDVNDVTWWRDLDLPMRIMLDRSGRVAPLEFDPATTVDAGAARDAYEPLVGLSVERARTAIVELLGDGGHLMGPPRPMRHSVRFYEKGDRPLELLPVPQWFMRIRELKDEFLAVGESLRWQPPSMANRYRNWVAAISQDWAVSRQRFFGVPFPLWYPLDKHGVADESRPLLATPGQLPVDPAIHVPEGYAEADRGTPGGFTADPDVMDTWATSSLSPRIAAGLVDDELFDQLRPFDLRPQSHEIIRTWLFYTVVREFAANADKPWSNVAISGWILDPDRKKMSKSKGNVVTPMALLEEHGSDAIRYWSAKGRPGADTAFDVGQIRVGRRLAMKLLNVSRFVLQESDAGALDDDDEVVEPVDSAMLHRLQRTVSTATAAFDAYDYTRALEATEQFFWWLADDYLELVKRRFYGGDGDAGRRSAAAALRRALDVQVRMFAPFMPFVTEEVWSWWHEDSVHLRRWPEGETLAAAPAGDVEHDELLDLASEVLHEVRRRKSLAKVKMRAPVRRMSLVAPPGQIELLKLLSSDLRLAGEIESIELSEGESLTVEVDLGEAVGDASP